jgi:hypothetical protein
MLVLRLGMQRKPAYVFITAASAAIALSALEIFLTHRNMDVRAKTFPAMRPRAWKTWCVAAFALRIRRRPHAAPPADAASSAPGGGSVDHEMVHPRIVAPRVGRSKRMDVQTFGSLSRALAWRRLACSCGSHLGASRNSAA